MHGRRWHYVSVYQLLPVIFAILRPIFPLASQNSFAELATPDNSIIEEIIVTARKYEEDVQQVPMSLQVLASDYLADSALNHFYDLQFSLPGYVVRNQGVFGANDSLRGVSSATHLDAVYQGTSNLGITRLFDMERIEVLKGPQGTLYGGNATGGSVNIITHAANDAFAAGVEATRGSFDLTRLNGFLNIPFASGAFRLAAIGSDSDGYIRNSIDDRKFAEHDYYGVRASIKVEPGNHLGFDLKLQRVFDDGASGDLWVPRKDFLPDPDDIRLTTVTLQNPFLESTNDNASATVELELDFATLRSISGYGRSELRNRDDCAGVPRLAGCVREIIPLKYKQRSQELQLLSQDGGAFDWLLGTLYFASDLSYNYLLNAPLVSSLPPNDQHNTTEQTVFAIFGQANLYPAKGWEVTGGLRLSRNTVEQSIAGTGVADYPLPINAKDDWVNFTWRLDTSYSLRQGFLVYTSASTGFNSGGITTQQLPSGQTSGLLSFDPEYLTAFEIGAKTHWKEGRVRLNAAAFYYDFDDMQVITRTFVGNTFVTVTENAAQAEMYGIDANLNLQLTKQLSVSSAVVWMPKREYVDYRNEVTGDVLSGNQLILAPEWSTSTSLSYKRPISDLGIISASLEYNFRSGIFFTQENDPTLAQGSFGLLNARLKFESASGRWYLFASARNLGDKDYFTQVFLQSAPGYPDTYEVGIGLHL